MYHITRSRSRKICYSQRERIIFQDQDQEEELVTANRNVSYFKIKTKKNLLQETGTYLISRSRPRKIICYGNVSYFKIKNLLQPKGAYHLWRSRPTRKIQRERIIFQDQDQETHLPVLAIGPRGSNRAIKVSIIPTSSPKTDWKAYSSQSKQCPCGKSGCSPIHFIFQTFIFFWNENDIMLYISAARYRFGSLTSKYWRKSCRISPKDASLCYSPG